MNKRSYKKLKVWKKAMSLVEEVYNLTESLPKEERFGLSSQMRQAAVSIPSNIAEGRYRSSKKEFIRFLYNAFGSGGELETQIEVSKQLGYFSEDESRAVDEMLTEVMKMLNSMIGEMEG